MKWKILLLVCLLALAILGDGCSCKKPVPKPPTVAEKEKAYQQGMDESQQKKQKIEDLKKEKAELEGEIRTENVKIKDLKEEEVQKKAEIEENKLDVVKRLRGSGYSEEEIRQKLSAIGMAESEINTLLEKTR